MKAITPTIGQIVHYGESVNRGFGFSVELWVQPVAAMIVDIRPAAVDLQVFDRNGRIYFANGVQYSEDPDAGKWSWPPRED